MDDTQKPAELDTPAIRARRRPFGVLAFWALRLLAAWLLAVPIAGALGGGGVARFPEGDALLFAPGATYLMEALRRGLGPLVAGLQNAAWFAVILGYLSLVPLAGLLYALCHAGRLRPGDVARGALEQLAPFTLLAGLTLLAQAAAAVLGIILVSVLRASIYESMNVRSADLALLGAAGIVLLVVLGIGLLEDLARAALVRHRRGLGSALRTALHTARQRPLAALSTWLAPATWSVAAITVGALAVGHLHVERAGSWRVLGALALHQLVALALVGLKAQWLAGALRLVGKPEQPEQDSVTPRRWLRWSGGTPAGSAARVDPSPDPGALSGA